MRCFARESLRSFGGSFFRLGRGARSVALAPSRGCRNDWKRLFAERTNGVEPYLCTKRDRDGERARHGVADLLAALADVHPATEDENMRKRGRVAVLLPECGDESGVLPSVHSVRRFVKRETN